MEKELTLPPNQLLAMFNKVIKKMINLLEELSVSQMNKILFSDANNGGFKLDKKMDPLKQSLEDELNEASRKVKSDEMQHKKELLSNFDLKQWDQRIGKRLGECFKVAQYKFLCYSQKYFFLILIFCQGQIF